MRSHWRVIVAFLLACLGGWALIQDFASVDQIYERAGTTASDHYRSDTQDKIRKASVLAPLLERQKCLAQADHAARENERIEENLTAQKTSAWWTKLMGIAAWLGVFFSVLGVGLV